MKDFQRLPLNALKAFEAVARLGSYRAAASELFVTHGAVSQQIKKLESHLATTLLSKQGRGIRLSEQGQLLYKQLQPLLMGLGELSRNLDPQAQSGTLRIACSSDTAVLWLVPALPSFCRQHPDIAIDIRPITDSEPNPIDVDIAILNQLPEASPYHWSLLSDQYFFPVCSPELANDMALSSHSTPLLHADRGGLWAAWFRESNTPYMHERPQLYLPGGAAVISGAKAGLGIALAHKLEVHEAIAKQQLVSLGDYQIKAAQAYFISSTQQAISSRAGVFIDWLKHYCASIAQS
ncbi:LysR substrate-binding domain-containing protein [Dasania sp. GY-MA-18]|uniref:LysR substrate-binding domain-containing protein n=1 Tax=Dasania phycosphaerae TaxID=2950436 RepID=A0A9J6RLF5_9GAMM|nr:MULTISPECIES: LysR substrate-binding domain-containing protein [Dasania]MCR8922788.1 LysR substrate-binding domain-containing protein [Dasania sp. GY-MA-18]MCZ0865218.1 LysR substrate-binding domain-containing protein [Dasania phycosphaerae]MCZ0868944.1 LysR substrate-binding domain-containing protein [Dasania phycosphaerae]